MSRRPRVSLGRSRLGEPVMRVDGACHCGNVAFEAEVDPETVRICHCTDCQTTSGSLFRANIPAAGETFRLVRGSPKLYIKTADSGEKRAQAFCADCGSGLYSTSPVNPTGYVLRVGTIAQRAAFRPMRQIWCQSELPWTTDVGGLERRERQ
jgi:hypothetical protein